MSSLRNLFAALVGLVFAFGAPSALAQSATETVGAWHGKVTPPGGGALTLVLYVSQGEDGTLTAEVESPDQAPGRKAPVTEIAVEDGKLTFAIAPLRASYEGTWSAAEQQWQGTFTQGMGLELNLARGTPEAKPVVEGLDGTWRGTVSMNGADLRFVVKIDTGEGGTQARLDMPDQLQNNIPLSGLERDGSAVRFAYAPGQQSFSGALSADGETLVGEWRLPNGTALPLTLTRTSASTEQAARNRPQTPTGPFPYKVEDVAIANPSAEGVTLAGTLSIPEGEGPFPAAVLLSGSGAQDRDENLFDHRPFAVIADYLARRGIAVLRFDDRGTAQSTGDFAASDAGDFATDANAAARYLMARPEVRADAVGFIGHSEGGMVGPIAMTDNPDVAFLVMLAGPGTRLDQLLLSQRRLAGAQMGLSEAMLDRSEPVMAKVFAALANAATPEEGEAAARAVLTPDAMEALGAPRETDPVVILNQLSGPSFRYFLRYDPAPNLQRIDVPILALNGSLDVQVPASENLPAIKAATAGNPDVTLVELPGLNHLFQPATTGAVGEYADIETTIAPVVLETLAAWLTERFVTN